MLELFINILQKEDKSENTIKSYSRHVKDYILWFEMSFNINFTKLYRENLLDYKSFLINVKKLNARSINAVWAALIKYNEFLLDEKVQNELVIFKKDYISVQTQYASPAIISKSDVENFRQLILENESKRDYVFLIR